MNINCDKNIKTFDLILTNGDRILRKFDIFKIYNVVEKERVVYNFNNKFPFIHLLKKKYVKFRYRNYFEHITSFHDSTFNVDCSMECFKRMIGCNCPSFEEESIKSMVINGR